MNSEFDLQIKNLSSAAKIIKQTFGRESTELVDDYINQLDALMQNGWKYALAKEDEIDENLLPQKYNEQRTQVVLHLHIRLGRLAEKYRSAPEGSGANTKALTDYHETYAELIRINGGIIGLDPDAELPDELMPKDYVEFWLK